MTPSFRLISGRMPNRGARELITGELARRKFSSLDTGAVDFLGARWRIVGTFADGDIMDGYLIGDAQTLKEAINHPIDTILLARLTAPDRFEIFREVLQKRLPRNVRVEREPDHYANIWKGKVETSAIFDIAYLLGGLIGAGMVAETMITMRIAVEARAQEIAILRAISFGGFAMGASVVLEAMLLAVLGGVIGAALVWLWLDGFLYNAGGVITVRVDLHLLLVGAGWALTVALIGAMAPAVRLARQTPIEALREV
jgi:putative ABC transport system permease protein